MKVLPLIVLLTSTTAFAAQDYDTISDKICDCLKAPYQEADKAMEMLAAAQKSGNLSALVNSQDEMMVVLNTARLCMEDIRERYPEIGQSTAAQDTVMKMTDDKCPNPLSSPQKPKDTANPKSSQTITSTELRP